MACKTMKKLHVTKYNKAVSYSRNSAKCQVIETNAE